MKGAAVTSLILWITIFLISILVQEAISHDYEHDKPPLVSPVVYTHNEEGETDLEGDDEDQSEEKEDSFLHWNADHIAKERDFIQEHIMNLTTMDTLKMTKAELEFHYFKLNDIDQDNYLDGLELIKSIISLHWHDENQHRLKLHNRFQRKLLGNVEDYSSEKKVWSDGDLASMIDPILQKHDMNGDGLIDYTEYKSSLRR